MGSDRPPTPGGTDGPPSVMLEILKKEIAEKERLKMAAESVRQMIADAEQKAVASEEALRTELARAEKTYIDEQVAQATEKAEATVRAATQASEERLKRLDQAAPELIQRGVRLVLGHEPTEREQP